VAFPAEEFDQKVKACKAASTAAGSNLKIALSNLSTAFKLPNIPVCPKLLPAAQAALAPFKKTDKDMDELLTKIKGLYC
jgi:hypothetical protein